MYGDGAKLKGFLLKCPERDKVNFGESNVALLVSVGKDYHEGEKLAAAVKFIGKRFKSCNVMINDTLQKYTYALFGNFSTEEAVDISVKQGQEWLMRNKNCIDTMQIPHIIHRWDEWLHDPEFTASKNTVLSHYEKNALLNSALDKSIKEFLNRNNHKIFDYKRAYMLCMDYLIEEIAVIMELWKSRNIDFIIYPGGMINVLQVYRDLYVISDDLKWLHLKFRRNNKKMYQRMQGEGVIYA